MQNIKSGIKYWTYGDVSNYPIFLVHGFTGSHEGFQYLIPELKKHFFVIAPDLPGFGKSRHATEPWTAEHLAKETNDFLKSLRLTQAPHLISHSMGGLIAAHMLTQNPELFHKKSIFISPVPNKVTWKDVRKAGAIAGRLQYALGHHITKIATSRTISRIATAAMLRTTDKTLRKKIYRHHFDNLRYISSSKYYERIHTDITSQGVIDLKNYLKNFKILIITGSHDNVTPLKHQKTLVKQLNAALHVIPGTGHLAHYEHPDIITREIISYLTPR
jgi:pimeloyl-ACP methyl ester carboxylesterase